MYSLRFQRAPSPAQRRVIVAALEARLAGSAVNTDVRAFRWHEDWLIFLVGETHPGAPMEPFFRAMKEALQAVHEATHEGLAEVVFRGERERRPEDAWSRWSEQQAPRPTPPEWATGLVDAACEQERLRARTEALRQRAAAHGERRPRGGEPVLVALPAEPRPDFFETAAGHRYRFQQKRGLTDLELERDGVWQRIRPGVNADSVRLHAASPDGKRLLVGVKSVVWEVDLANDTADDLLDLHTAVQGVAWLTETRILALSSAECWLVDIADRSAIQFVRHAVYDGAGVFVALGGQLVILVRRRAPHPVELLARQGNLLFRFATTRPAIDRVFERDGRVLAWQGADLYELLDVQDALEAYLGHPEPLDELQYLGDGADREDD